MKLRSIREIAAEITTLWRRHPPPSQVYFRAKPYVVAMSALDTCKDMYGAEYGDMVVLYALNNMHNWRGEDARRIKAELNQHVKEFNNDRDSRA